MLAPVAPVRKTAILSDIVAWSRLLLSMSTLDLLYDVGWKSYYIAVKN